MECRNCNTENPDDAKFCRVCGSDLSEMMTKWKTVGDFKVKVRIRWWQMIILILLGCVLSVSTVYLMYCIYQLIRGWHPYLWDPIGFTFVSGLLYVFSYRRFRYKKLSKFAVVVEENSDRNEVLIKKNGQYGLLDKQQQKITFPVIYDDIRVDSTTLDVLVVYKGEIRNADIQGHVY